MTDLADERGAHSTVEQAAEGAREKAGELKSQAGTRVREQLDERTTQVGEQARSVAQAMRQSSQTLREQDRSGAAGLTEQAAERVERLGTYLEHANGESILRDVEEFGRRRPWLLAGAGLAVGLIASRVLKASSEQRYASAGADGSAQRWPTRAARPTVGGGSERVQTYGPTP